MTNYININTMYFKAAALWCLIKKKGVLGLKQVADAHHNSLLHSYTVHVLHCVTQQHSFFKTTALIWSNSYTCVTVAPNLPLLQISHCMRVIVSVVLLFRDFSLSLIRGSFWSLLSYTSKWSRSVEVHCVKCKQMFQSFLTSILNTVPFRGNFFP